MRLCSGGPGSKLPNMEAAALTLMSQEAGGPARPGLTRDQVMTAAEVAELLQLPVSTV
jgi:hypothetical protein